MKSVYLIIFFLFIFSNTIFTQNAGEEIFDNSYVHEIRITFSDPNFWQIMTNNYFNSEVNGVPMDVPYLEGTISIDGNILDSVGVRQKGFSSHFTSNEFKKSIKLDFNEFISGQNYDGMKKINLNNGVGDPAMQRDILAFDLMRESGVRAPRTSYAKVFLNDEYWGLYLILEQIDKNFLENNFVSGGGDLYKNIDFSSLQWFGSNPNNYAESIALRTNKTTSDFSDFIEFVDVLNNSTDVEFANSIVNVFNVDYYLRVLAIDVMTDNWDSYLDHGRNFYLYHEPISDQIFWIPWDYNLSMGGAFFANPDLPANAGNCISIVNGTCPYPADDPIFLEVIETCDQCCNGTWGGLCQTKYDNIAMGNGVNFLDLPLIQNNSEKILIDRIMNVPAFRERYLDHCCQILEHNFTIERLAPIVDFNGALIADAVEEDNNFIFNFEQFNYDISEGDGTRSIPSLKEFFNHRISVLEQNLIDFNHTCNSLVSTIGWNDVVINEFVASNDSLSGITDQDGEFDDWIEIYNNTNSIVDLTSFYLTDNFNSKKQWAFPEGTNIGVDEYLIVWADKDIDQEGFHTNFKLSGLGEQLMLVHFDGTVIDSVSYAMQTTNIPTARIPNGTGEFTSAISTFAVSNSDMVSTNELELIEFNVYPNPVKDVVTLSVDKNTNQGEMQIVITNLLGQIVYNNTNSNGLKVEISVKNWSSGVYMIAIQGDDFRGVKKLVVD